ncbi:FAD-binding oxidoreductase [Mitsuaria sp. WAJ17]|uniref:FAD-binding oxidoreductase n=1 Tax=Mitsuaria sp. WAJ17 TaxID=2761452 RepID=UPI001602F1E7|nr:FAD-binding oxidoreductase [Mitsuaria sp. WAJ17]MBB2483705.1 FAD-binding oxidoreductase [Mitsuaria sp. WAJ17]
MQRRQTLAWAAASAAAFILPGCGGGASSPTPAPPPGPTTTPIPAEWQALSRQVQGQLLLPGQAAYEQGRVAANARFDDRRPQGLLRCAVAADVQAGLAHALSQRLPFALRSGGHSYVGSSAGSGLVIDLGPMNSVRLEGEVAVVGAGATLADVYGNLIPLGRCVASGSCLSVGITGIALGGGFGVIDRSQGLACDQLLGAQLLTADGRLLDCDAQHNAELFWALRGGGGGHFGVVTQLRLRTHATGPLQLFLADFPLEALPAALAAWQGWPAQGLPDAIWSQLVLPAGSPQFRIWGVAAGDAAPLQPYWSALLQRIGRSPQAQQWQASSYGSVMMGACQSYSLPQCHLPSQREGGLLGRVSMTASSDFFDRPLDAAGIAALSDGVAARQGTGVAVLNLMGGAIARVAPQDTAFVHRQALFSAQYLCEYPAGTAESTLAGAEQWAQGMRDRMKAWSSGGAYVNYPNALQTRAAEAWYGANLARLQALKAAVDPQGVFAPLERA